MSPPNASLKRLARWARGVRARTAAAAIVIVSAALALGGVGVVWLLQSSLDSSTANAASAEALDIASFITSRGVLPRRLPVSLDEMAAQVVSSNGTVLSASRNFLGQPPMLARRLAPRRTRTQIGVYLHPRLRRADQTRLDLDYRYAVAAAGFSAPGLSGTVLVADSLGAADHAVSLVALAVIVALPVLALLVGGLVWALTGRALEPVERMRREVADLSLSGGEHRLLEPATDDEIGRLARTMNAMLERLDASRARERQLVADVSHELRNPLAALRAQLEVAERADPGEAPVLLSGSVAEVERLSGLVANLLALARLEEGSGRVRRDEVDLDELALSAAGRLRARGQVAVSVRGVSGARLFGDRSQLDRLITNLADNAERHASGTVSFSVRREPDGVVLVVADDGPGIPEASRERIFERFVRLDSARTHRDAGAGLGLAIVREIARAHGGDVHVEDNAPGARMVVRIPVAAELPDEAPAAPLEVPEAPARLPSAAIPLDG
ncbi:MAG: HAMP domain-containing sensor histidine kinase [Actinomycetota bacterium]|nr:HAMP domain-containing sensor histidine kinase [Actinomycetota bacterium]